ncbi:MAG: hypothetical protein HOV80_34815 [Polyangiaceae bacterium]|nr:hypothetical protein [Polyangiaceae bacterium]
MTRDQSGPHDSGAPASRPDTDTFRPAAGDAEDAYSAETVVKAIPRELLADLAKALKAPAVPSLGQEPKSSPAAVPKPTRSAAPTPRVPFAMDALGEDDNTVIDHRLDRDLSELDFDSPPPSKPLPPPRMSDETPKISAFEPAPISQRSSASAQMMPPPSSPGALPAPLEAPVVPLEAAPQSVPEPPPVSQQLARVSSADIDENTDFRAGTRWPWITAIVMILISFAVTLTILRNL